MNEGRLQCSYIRESAISFSPFCEIVHYITIVYLSLAVSNHGWHSFLPECCLQGSCEAAEN